MAWLQVSLVAYSVLFYLTPAVAGDRGSACLLICLCMPVCLCRCQSSSLLHSLTVGCWPVDCRGLSQGDQPQCATRTRGWRVMGVLLRQLSSANAVRQWVSAVSVLLACGSWQLAAGSSRLACMPGVAGR
ncbi:hypothetical protein COO60DRAFT_1532176 [Scenedesmus sp. NREL 46B-D3]|nr:hypothetical protein COO60DRAFT_1532176 [Scenedesmus sp. NREL 46B-D3]